MAALPGIFQSAHLSYFPFTEGDFGLMRELDTDPDVVKFLGHGKVKSEEETRESFTRVLSQTKKYGVGLYATHLRATGKFIGRTGLIQSEIDGETLWEVGYTLAKAFWGKGLASEAAKFWIKTGFEKLDVPQLISVIQPGNAASVKIATAQGMTFWKKSEHHGRPIDVYRVART